MFKHTLMKIDNHFLVKFISIMQLFCHVLNLLLPIFSVKWFFQYSCSSNFEYFSNDHFQPDYTNKCNLWVWLMYVLLLHPVTSNLFNHLNINMVTFIFVDLLSYQIQFCYAVIWLNRYLAGLRISNMLQFQIIFNEIIQTFLHSA